MTRENTDDDALIAKERVYIPSELDRFMTSPPAVADGFMLRIWRTGPNVGQPKIPPAGQSLVSRGMLRLDTSVRPPPLYFIEAGLAALRRRMANSRLADPKAFAHIRRNSGSIRRRTTRPRRSQDTGAPGGRDGRDRRMRRPRNCASFRP